MLQDLESYDQFMPTWLTDAQGKMAQAEANGQSSTSKATSTSSESHYSSLQNLAGGYMGHSEFRSGAIWEWHHWGVNAAANAQVEFTSNNKVRWNNGAEIGSWKLNADNTLSTSWNGVDHVMKYNEADDDWVLITPVRNPQTTMKLVSVPQTTMKPQAHTEKPDSYIENFDTDGRVDFNGGGAGMHEIGNMSAGSGSHVVFSLQNLAVFRETRDTRDTRDLRDTRDTRDTRLRLLM